MHEVTINKDVPYPVKEPPQVQCLRRITAVLAACVMQVITVKKPYTVKVPGHRDGLSAQASGSALLLPSSGHYVDVPVPSPPRIVNKYKYHYVTVHDYDARHRRLLKGMVALPMLH